MTIVIDGSGSITGISAGGLPDNSVTSADIASSAVTVSKIDTTVSQLFGMRNRIINGAMVIDQRNAGASVTPSNGQYTLDRWTAQVSQASKYTIQQNAAAVTPPAGYSKYLGVTSSSAYAITASDIFTIYQGVEGLNITDLAWGTASAQTITISFWVRSSLTGTFGGVVQNSAQDRSYPYTYTISVANTWEQKSVTIAGDTSGTWLTTTGVGLRLFVGLGVGSTYSGTAGAWSGSTLYSATGATSVVGTNGATFYITGVQLELGSTATPFERRLYDKELISCQRYYYRLKATASYQMIGTGFAEVSTLSYAFVKFPVTMRTNPTALESSGTNSNYFIIYQNQSTACTATPSFYQTMTNEGCGVYLTCAALLTSGNGIAHRIDVSGAYLGWSAEL